MKRVIPELWVEQYALGELPDARRREVEEALGEELPARLEALRQSDEAVRSGLPPRVFASRVQATTRRPHRSVWLGALATVLAAALVVAVLPVDSVPPEGVEITRAKGRPMLQIHRRIGLDAEPLRHGGVAHPGDVLQVSYTSGGAAFGAVGSLDGNGVLTWHLPLDGERSVRLESGSGVPLAESYELDDAPDHERFFLITGPVAFDLPDLEPTLRDWRHGSELRLNAPLRGTVFEVAKGGAP